MAKIKLADEKSKVHTIHRHIQILKSPKMVMALKTALGFYKLSPEELWDRHRRFGNHDLPEIQQLNTLVKAVRAAWDNHGV